MSIRDVVRRANAFMSNAKQIQSSKHKTYYQKKKLKKEGNYHN